MWDCYSYALNTDPQPYAFGSVLWRNADIWGRWSDSEILGEAGWKEIKIMESGSKIF